MNIPVRKGAKFMLALPTPVIRMDPLEIRGRHILKVVSHDSGIIYVITDLFYDKPKAKTEPTSAA